MLRDAEHLNAAQAAELAARLGEPFSPNVLVLAVVGKALPAALAQGGQGDERREIDTSPGSSGKARTQWLNEQLQVAPGSPRRGRPPPSRAASRRGRVPAATRCWTFSSPRTAMVGRVGPAELAPFLGEEGGAPPWDLTDALDKGDVATAVRVAHRLLGPGGRHPFQLLAMLHKHYGAMLRLDGSGVTDPHAAASLLNMAPLPRPQGARPGSEARRRSGSPGRSA